MCHILKDAEARARTCRIDDEVVLVTGHDTTAAQRHLVLSDPTGFAVGDYVQVDNEVVRVTALDTTPNNTLAVARHQALHPTP